MHTCNVWLWLGLQLHSCDSVGKDLTLFSLHICSMWETICDAQAGFWLNSKFLSKFSRKPLSEISDQKSPPNEKIQIWDDQSLLWNTPPKWKTLDLRWPKFTLEYPLPPSSPKMKNFIFEMTKVYSGIPPPNEKLQIWDDQSLLWNTPRKMKNFRFEMTKVYSGIPPPQWKTSYLRSPKFTPEYPPEGLQSGRSYVETNLYPPWIPLVCLVWVTTWNSDTSKTMTLWFHGHCSEEVMPLRRM